MSDYSFGTIIVGGGPAGIGVILAACRNGQLHELLDRGLAIIESGTEIGAGRIGGYGINSDSTGDTFVDCIRNNPYAEFTALLDHPLVQEFMAAGQNSMPLPSVGALSLLVGSVIHDIVSTHPGCAVFTETQAISMRPGLAATWRLQMRTKNALPCELDAQHVVLATGAAQPLSRLASETVSGKALLPLCQDRLLQSGEVLQTGGVQAVAARLAGKSAPKIAIIGGSTSAVAVAHALLTRAPPPLFKRSGVTILHRRELRIYYASTAQALAEGYTAFTEQDLCPLTGRVYRLAGLRLDSRELIMQAKGIGGRPAEPRLRLHHLQDHDPAAVQIIKDADLVIAALGYRPHALRVIDEQGQDIELLASQGANTPLVDHRCRVLDKHRKPLAGVYGIGLAAGFVPQGNLGGEPSFSGQANGLWLWQTAVGALIVEALLATSIAPTYAPEMAVETYGLTMPGQMAPLGAVL